MENKYARCEKCIYSDIKIGKCNFYNAKNTSTYKPGLLTDRTECIRFKEKKMTVEQSLYRKNIIEKLDKQVQKGIDKYGTTLEQNKWFSTLDRLTYLQEELIDGLVYIEHIMAKLEELNIDLD